MKKVSSALISVFNKNKIEHLCQILSDNNVKIYSPINGYCMYNKNLCTQYSSNLTKININEKNGYMIILKKGVEEKCIYRVIKTISKDKNGVTFFGIITIPIS